MKSCLGKSDAEFAVRGARFGVDEVVGAGVRVEAARVGVDNAIGSCVSGDRSVKVGS